MATYVNKVVFGDTTLLDLTSDTVTASVLMEGYTAHDKTGALIIGTATGGGGSGDGYVWQDQDGYVHLSDEEGTQISVEALSVTQNGTYTAPTGTAYSPVTVNVSGGGGGSEELDAIIGRTISGSYTNNTATTIGNYAFAYCSSLTTASFPNVASIGNYAFAGCTRLTTASFSNATTIGTSTFAGCSSLTTANFPNVTSVGDYAFTSCSSLTTASFPKTTTIGTSAFYYCSSLTTASFPSATNIKGYAFAGCFSLTTGSFPSVTSIGGSAFYSCRSLATASFPNVTSIGAQAFRSCSRLMSLYILASSVATLGNSAFLSTPMSISTYTGSFGSIYVPASLVSTYQTATNWASYSARITSYNG